MFVLLHFLLVLQVDVLIARFPRVSVQVRLGKVNCWAMTKNLYWYNLIQNGWHNIWGATNNLLPDHKPGTITTSYLIIMVDPGTKPGTITTSYLIIRVEEKLEGRREQELLTSDSPLVRRKYYNLKWERSTGDISESNIEKLYGRWQQDLVQWK